MTNSDALRYASTCRLVLAELHPRVTRVLDSGWLWCTPRGDFFSKHDWIEYVPPVQHSDGCQCVDCQCEGLGG